MGDIFVAGNPAFFDNDKLYEEYKKRKEKGFPCDEYHPICIACEYNTSEHKCIHPDSFFEIPPDNGFCSFGAKRKEE